MNKRQRKKKYIETFSKFYDKSVETFGKNPQITINLIKKDKGGIIWYYQSPIALMSHRVQLHIILKLTSMEIY